MKSVTALAVVLLGCVPALGGTRAQLAPVPVFGRSLNRSDVDVYLVCGDRDARWLGTVPRRSAAALEISPPEARCVRGLTLFLVVRDRNWGYRVGPFRPGAGAGVELVVERYAGLSTVRVWDRY